MDKDDTVSKVGLEQIGRVICDTSDAADGAPRVIVEWEGGEEATLRVADLRRRTPVYLPRTRVQTWL